MNLIPPHKGKTARLKSPISLWNLNIVQNAISILIPQWYKQNNPFIKWNPVINMNGNVLLPNLYANAYLRWCSIEIERKDLLVPGGVICTPAWTMPDVEHVFNIIIRY
ncbi:hypothetical protein CEXT_232901 [Caerostris extrusa]|uniref:Uncharacterized protein n=1 Tax=Caerostris extrusa TaxID=172846 RepID=A0AAV4XCN9_CAEEX|nr:hypothetical protein CEXT_232901 [Caerostris extrusa]